jgi:hypothetical protein
MKKISRNKKIKEAGILLLAAFLLLSTSPAMANTTHVFNTKNISDHSTKIFFGDTPKPLGENAIFFYTSDPAHDIGLNSGGTFEAAIRITPIELAPYSGANLVAARIVYDGTGGHSCKLKIYDKGTAVHPGALLASKEFTADAAGWIRIDLDTPIALNISNDIWISFEVTHAANEFPYATDDGPAVDKKGDFVMAGAQWIELQNAGATPPLDYNWMIEAIVVTEGPSPTELEISSISVNDFTILNATIKNKGQTEAINVVMSMDVSGGILHLINKTFPGSAASLASGASISLLSEKMFGLGKIAILVTAKADNADEVSKQASGFIVGPLVFGVK